MKISYCVNCHNRLWQLEKTISHNLAFTKANEIEICVLAYNDETIEPYLREHYHNYIRDGRLKVKTHIDPKPYSFGYVKNISHSMGRGRVLFNLDSDNFIDGCQDELLILNDSQLLITDKSYLSDGRGGRIGMTQRTFKKLDGYLDDQASPDDDDLICRAMRLGKFLKRASCPIPPLSNTP